MEKIPRMPSKSENHAKIRCKGEEKKLRCVKEDLDKLRQAETRYLGTHRHRFLLDRRRSLGQVYDSHVEGIQPHMRIRRRRRGTDPEVIDIFRRQAARRTSVQAMETAVASDVMRRLERKYRKALEQDWSSSEDEDSSSDSELGSLRSLSINGPDQDTVKTREARRHARRGRDSPEHTHDLQTSGLSGQPDRGQGTVGAEGENLLDHTGDRYEDVFHTTVHSHSTTHANNIRNKIPQADRSRQTRLRKRSHSDGNIAVSMFDLSQGTINPYALAKDSAATSGSSGGEDSSDDSDGGRDDEEDPAASQGAAAVIIETPGISRNETFVIKSDVTDSSATRRRGTGVSFELPLPDVSSMSSPPTTRHTGDVTTRSLRSDVTFSPSLHRRQGNESPQPEKIVVSPSLRRRLAKADVTPSPRTNADKRHSDLTPSPTPRRLARADPNPSPRTNADKRHSDLTPSPTPRRRNGADAVPSLSYASPKPARRTTTGFTSQTAPRKDASDRPKPIYQTQPRPDANTTPLKRRPLRRSRSEAVDLSALISSRTERDFLGLRTISGRRGSDSIQVLGHKSTGVRWRPPKSWNSLLYGLALSEQEREEIARHKRRELVTSLRKRQEEVDGDVSRRIRTFLQRYEDD